MSSWKAAAEAMKETIRLRSEPVAVFLLPAGPTVRPFDRFEAVTGHRYCQLLMRARHGESVRIEPAEVACPAAAAAFGFRPLPEALVNGKGLTGFGIVAEASTGQAMFESMTRLPPGSIGGVAVCPLAHALAPPDVVVVEGQPEALMWLALASLNVAGGQRQCGDTAVLQAVCVDATLIPHVERRLNFSLGCYGCREATNLGPDEAILGFPAWQLDGLIEALQRLRATAVPRARARKPYEVWVRTQAPAHERQG